MQQSLPDDRQCIQIVIIEHAKPASENVVLLGFKRKDSFSEGSFGNLKAKYSMTFVSPTRGLIFMKHETPSQILEKKSKQLAVGQQNTYLVPLLGMKNRRVTLWLLVC